MGTVTVDPSKGIRNERLVYLDTGGQVYLDRIRVDENAGVDLPSHVIGYLTDLRGVSIHTFRLARLTWVN